MAYCCVAVQLCRLVLHRHYDGNVIFEVTSSRPSQSTALDYQVAKCSHIKNDKDTRTNVFEVNINIEICIAHNVCQLAESEASALLC